MKHYTVSGRGRFPIDMLRYDASFPASEFDSELIEQTNPRQVQLSTHVNHVEFSKGRWASFGWQVKKIW